MKRYIIFLICMLVCGNVFSQNRKCIIPDSTSYIVLSSQSNIIKNAKLVYCNVSRFPFLMGNNTLLMLANDDVDELVTFNLPKEIDKIEDVFIKDSLLICKDSNIIKNFNGEKVDTILIMPDDNYNIYPANDDYFYIVKHDEDSSSVYMVETVTGKFIKLFDSPVRIDNLAGTGYECIITCGNLIYFIAEGICIIVDEADSIIQSIDYYKGGAFYSTKNACYYLGLSCKSYPFINGNVKQLMLVDNHLYLLFSDGLLSVIDNADGYRRLFSEIINEQNEKGNEIH